MGEKSRKEVVRDHARTRTHIFTHKLHLLLSSVPPCLWHWLIIQWAHSLASFLVEKCVNARHDADQRLTGKHVGHAVASGLRGQDMQRGRTDVCLWMFALNFASAYFIGWTEICQRVVDKLIKKKTSGGVLLYLESNTLGRSHSNQITVLPLIDFSAVLLHLWTGQPRPAGLLVVSLVKFPLFLFDITISFRGVFL